MYLQNLKPHQTIPFVNMYNKKNASEIGNNTIKRQPTSVALFQIDLNNPLPSSFIAINHTIPPNATIIRKTMASALRHSSAAQIAKGIK